jgi:hypothetical protein
MDIVGLISVSCAIFSRTIWHAEACLKNSDMMPDAVRCLPDAAMQWLSDKRMIVRMRLLPGRCDDANVAFDQARPHDRVCQAPTRSRGDGSSAYPSCRSKFDESRHFR